MWYVHGYLFIFDFLARNCWANCLSRFFNFVILARKWKFKIYLEIAKLRKLFKTFWSLFGAKLKVWNVHKIEKYLFINTKFDFWRQNKNPKFTAKLDLDDLETFYWFLKLKISKTSLKSTIAVMAWKLRILIRILLFSSDVDPCPPKNHPPRLLPSRKAKQMCRIRFSLCFSSCVSSPSINLIQHEFILMMLYILRQCEAKQAMEL